MGEGDSFVLEAPVQHGAELLLVLGVELEHGDLLAAVLLDVLEPHQGLELGDGPRGVQVSLGEQQQHRRGLQTRLVQQLCNENITQILIRDGPENKQFYLFFCLYKDHFVGSFYQHVCISFVSVTRGTLMSTDCQARGPGPYL